MTSFTLNTTTMRKHQQSTRLAFFIAGFAMSAWAPLVPYAKARAELTDGALGLLLLCLGAGSIIAMPLSGAIVTRKGCKPIIIAATLLACASLPFLTVFSTLPSLAVALFCFGAGVGTVDCTVNTQAVIVERESGKTLMSGFHGLFSLGGILGAGCVSALLALGTGPYVSTVVVVALVLGALYWASPNLLTETGEAKGPAFAVPHGFVVLLGLVCFAGFMAEGAMLDWSAVILVDLKNMASEHAGIGYAAFAATMTAGRFTGDRLVRKFGPEPIVIYGCLASAMGLMIGTLVPHWIGSLIGFALVGIGCANVAPVMYSQIGKQTAMPESLAVPAVSTLGYAGILTGPAFIGFIAYGTTLSFAFMVVAALLMGAAYLSRQIFNR
ncbi:MFS transporter [Pseudomonas akapageensis]|uniref:MFS transporter n=1 Tax=Pseudomonas akapageensis TaxID=2609961 RepID=UPI00140E58FD|nr:MFS transporter [Pseudomonas akapageensis]